MVPVLHEMQLPDPVDVDRRHRLALARGRGDPPPPRAHPPRGGAKAAVELAPPVDRAHDRVERDRLEAEPALAAPSQRRDYLLEGEDHVHVAGLAPQAGRDARERAPPALAPEVELGVGLGKACVASRHAPDDRPSVRPAKIHAPMVTPARTPRVTAVLRSEESVKPLELFFDLVFVLALTQCTALMADDPTWEGLARGLLILGVLWWAWVGYSWLTSVVDPEEGFVRIAIFAAMAGLLVVALCVPEAFDDEALLFAIAYGLVRAMQVVLLELAAREDAALRHSTNGLVVSTAVGTGLLVAASFTDGALQGGLWAVALLLDMGEPYLFGSEDWKLVPGHFAERHGLILIIALGESIVAIGVGAEGLD